MEIPIEENTDSEFTSFLIAISIFGICYFFIKRRNDKKEEEIL